MTLKAPHKMLLGMIGLMIAIAICVRLIDRWTERKAQGKAALERQYWEMTNALVSGYALERTRDHPINRLYHDRRDALVAAGYLKKHEFPLRHKFDSSKAAHTFLWRFAARFPGAEFQLSGAKAPTTPTLTVYARNSDLLAIKWFITQNDTSE
jgi:hypothetical protein